jgi:hypothetical protein
LRKKRFQGDSNLHWIAQRDRRLERGALRTQVLDSVEVFTESSSLKSRDRLCGQARDRFFFILVDVDILRQADHAKNPLEVLGETTCGDPLATRDLRPAA